MTPNAPRTQAEQFAFLRAAHDGPLVWRRLCQSLARQAPGLPAVYPSALSAAMATPESRRVYDVADLRRGMVAFFDDPNDSNPHAHVATVAGWATGARTLDALATWTNDARRTGGVDLVRASFYPDQWGDKFLFGATWLNGYDLPRYDSDAPTPDPKRPTIGANLDHAIADLRRAVRHHRAKRAAALADGRQDAARRHQAVVRALVEDLRELRETRRRYPR